MATALPIDTRTSARDSLVLEHMPLARRLARRYARSGEQEDELVQVAAVGLVKAVDGYDPDRGTAFSSYAVPTILGELKRHFRDTRWALHVSRSLQEQAQRVARTVDDLTCELGRAPSPAETAAALDVPVEEVIEAQEAFSAYEATSLDAPAPGGGDERGDSAGDQLGMPDDGFERVEQRAAIAPALATLPDRERLALHMRFVDDMTQAEIGARLGVSQMQVSRMLRRALTELRTLVPDLAGGV
jgi:RNA polymerase sigma-B factor